MELNQLEQFVAIATSGSMHEAATKLYLSQSTLSYNLKKLETELGCQLFVRDRNRLQITKFGEMLLKHAPSIEGSVQAFLDELDELKRRDRDMIHIGCYSTLFASFEMPQIAASIPEREFEVVMVEPGELRRGLFDGTFDAAITPNAKNWKSVDKKLLFREQAFVSAPKNTGFDEAEIVKLADLAGYPFLVESDMPGYTD